MSKQSEAKEAQGYQKRPACCTNCKNFTVDKVPRSRWPGDPYTFDKNKRCSIGGFAVQSTGYCGLFAWKD